MAHSLRSLAPADLPAVETILLANRPDFTDAECRTALALVREGLACPDDPHPYRLLAAEDDGGVAGYACFGSIPLTDGAYDLYWLAVAPDRYRRGVGRALCEAVEAAVAAEGGRLIVVEASSRAGYDRACRFYEGTMRYEAVARIRDFYRPGDDKVVYVRRLGTRERR